MHACRHRSATFSRQAVERAECLTVRRGDDPHSSLVASDYGKAVLAKGCPKRSGGVGLLPRLTDGLARVRKGDPMPICPSPLSARHGGRGWLGRGLVPNSVGNVVAAGTLKLSGYGGRPTAGSQVVAEVRFEAPCDGFETDEGVAVVKGAAVRPDVRHHQMVMGIYLAAPAGLLGMLPEHERMIIRAHRLEDAGNSFAALLPRERRAGRQRDVMTRDCRSAAVPKGGHVFERLVSGRHRRGYLHYARRLAILPPKVSEKVTSVTSGAAMAGCRQDHREGSRRAMTAAVKRASSARTATSASAWTRPP